MLKADNKKHIVVFLPFLTYGGAERQGMLLAEGLQKSGLFTVEVVGFTNNTRDYPLIKQLEKIGVSYQVLPFGMQVFFNRRQRLRAIIQFARLMHSKKADVLIPFTWWPNYLSAASMWLSGVKKCFWNQRSVDRHVPKTAWEKLLPVSKLTFVSNSNPGRTFIAERFNIPITQVNLINNGVLPVPVTGNAHRPAPVTGYRPVYMTMLANFYPEKDVLTVVKGIRILKDKGYNVRMRFAGNADNALGYKAKALAFDLELQEQIMFIPQVEDVEGLLQQTDIGVLSSSSEGCPNSVLEYISHKLPVLVSNIEAISDVTSKDYPYLFKLGNEADFAAKAVDLIDNLTRGNNSTGEMLHSRVLPDYRVDGMVQKFLTLINK